MKNKTNPKSLAVLLAMLFFSSCVDRSLVELPSLNAEKLKEVVLKEDLCERYVATMASNFISLRGISEGQKGLEGTTAGCNGKSFRR